MDKKVIPITGSYRGLGAHAAYRFAEKGLCSCNKLLQF